MSRIEVAPEIREDLDRILEHLDRHDVADPAASINNEFVQGVSILEHNPLIGRPLRHDLRELIVGRGAHGYVGLYRYIHELDTVFLLAIRNHREAGYQKL